MSGYFGARYFGKNYFAANYFGLPTPAGSGYFGATYFGKNYFAKGYFGGAPASAGNPVGSIAATLGDLSASIVGSFFKLTFNGQLAATLDDVSALFRATTAQLESFDLSVSITPTWHSTEYPGFLGSIVSTLGDLTSTIAGTFRATGAIDGHLVGTLDSLTASMQGTSVAPAGRIGLISATLDSLVATNMVGSVAPPGSRFGSINVTLDGLTALLVGELDIPNRTGSIAVQLDDLAGVITGISATSSIRLGSLVLTLDDVACLLVGTGPKFKKAVVGRTINPRGTSKSRVIKPRRLH